MGRTKLPPNIARQLTNWRNTGIPPADPDVVAAIAAAGLTPPTTPQRAPAPRPTPSTQPRVYSPQDISAALRKRDEDARFVDTYGYKVMPVNAPPKPADAPPPPPTPRTASSLNSAPLPATGRVRSSQEVAAMMRPNQPQATQPAPPPPPAAQAPATTTPPPLFTPLFLYSVAADGRAVGTAAKPARPVPLAKPDDPKRGGGNHSF